MSRGFVREDDQEEVPLVPQRAYLPQGVTNYVTRNGMEQLLAEKEALISERENLNITRENEKRIAVNYINAKLQLLNSRIAEARVIDPKEKPQNEVTFGAIVTLKNTTSGKIRTFQIVGVDEADIARGKVSFISPVARALMNKQTGERIILNQERADIVFEIVDITCL